MLKQSLKHFVRRTFGVDIVRKGSGWTLIEIEQLERFLKEFEIDCVFDVGANTGQYAECIFATGFQGTIVSFEPIPAAVAVLEKKASRNPRWKVIPTALDEVVRDVEFNIMASSQFSSLHSPDHTSTSIFVNDNTVVQKINLRARSESC